MPPQADLAVEVVIERDGDFVGSADRGPKTVWILAGETSAFHAVPTLDGPRDEPDGAVILTVQPSPDYVVSGPAGVRVGVLDNDPPAGQGPEPASATPVTTVPRTLLVAVQEIDREVDVEPSPVVAPTTTLRSAAGSAADPAPVVAAVAPDDIAATLDSSSTSALARVLQVLLLLLIAALIVVMFLARSTRSEHS